MNHSINLWGAESLSPNQLLVWVSIDHSFFDLANLVLFLSLPASKANSDIT